MWEPCHCQPCNPCRRKQNLDACLEEISKQFVSIKKCERKRAFQVFQTIFDQFKQKMKENSNYFEKYCTLVLWGESVQDNTKVAHMDEFDINIVIKLPINYNEIILENEQPGFLRLKITDAFDNLDKQPDWEQCHKEIRDWRDSDNYLLQSKIRQWLRRSVDRAINDLEEQVVDGTVYGVKYKKSGHAYTLQIRSHKEQDQFKLDVDLVPVIKFQWPQWPRGYKSPGYQSSQSRDWLVVPKPNKTIQDGALKKRSWRLSFQNSERDMMKGNKNLKTTIRLIKKLRDVLDLKSIASYYIKTLFLWEIKQGNDKHFWQKKLSVTFGEMVEKLYRAVKDRKIMSIWHSDHNLLKNVSENSLQNYELKLKRALGAIYSEDCETIADNLLTKNEIGKFKSTKFYKKLLKPTQSWNEGSVQNSLQPPKPFQTENKHGDIVSLASMTSAWQKWKRSFELFYEAAELSKKETKVQINILLHVIGEQGREVYDTFDEDFETVEELLQKFDDVFVPKKNITAERHKFFTRNQNDSETIEQYVTELKKMAIACEFKECDNIVSDRMISGLKDEELREKLLAKVNLTPFRAISIIKSAEQIAASFEEASFDGEDENELSDIKEENEKTAADKGTDESDNEQPERVTTPVKACKSCGYLYHSQHRCPAEGMKCWKCEELGHFAAVCTSTSITRT